MNPLLSIIIATKNRVPYCISAIESILSIDSNDIQLVIQDNTDNLDLKNHIESSITDNRLIYRYTPPPFSSIDNFNAAIELATGEYVCMIGDDDGINPEIIQATLWAKNNNVDAFVGSLSANYRWADTGAPDTLFTKMTGDTLTIKQFNGKASQPDIKKSLLRLMHNGCTNYLEFSLPKFYHGVVRRQCFDLIKEKTGAYIKGLSPDIYSSISLACVINKLVTIDYPLTIPGVCSASTSITEGQIRKHSKKLEDAPHFRSRGPYTWSPEVPRFYCVQTIWADSGFAALHEMGRLDLIEKFNKYSLYANIMSADFSNTKAVLNHMKSEHGKVNTQLFIDYILLTYAMIVGPFRKFIVQRFLSRLQIIIGLKRLEKLTNLPDIYRAMIALERYLKTTNIDINSRLLKIEKELRLD